MEDVIVNAGEALSLWFEDGAIVTPRDRAAISAEVADELVQGAFLIALS